MQTPAWVEDLYGQMKALQFEYLEVSGFLLGKQQRWEMEQFFREQEALGKEPSWYGPDRSPALLWGKPVVWSEAPNCAVPLLRQGVDVHYDDEKQSNRLSVRVDVRWAE